MAGPVGIIGGPCSVWIVGSHEIAYGQRGKVASLFTHALVLMLFWIGRRNGSPWVSGSGTSLIRNRDDIGKAGIAADLMSSAYRFRGRWNHEQET